jgi:hypothetical protein
MADKELIGTIIAGQQTTDQAGCQAACQAFSGCTGYTFYVPGYSQLNQSLNCSLYKAPLLGDRTSPGAVACAMPCLAVKTPTRLLNASMQPIKPLSPAIAAHLVPPLAVAPPASPPATATTPPATPSAFISTKQANGTTLNWIDNANNESGFEIERSIDKITWGNVARPPANATSHYLGLVVGMSMSVTAIHYRLRAVNSAGASNWVLTSIAMGAPATPGGTGGSNPPPPATPGTVTLRATADATVMASTAVPSNETVNLSSGPNSVGCFYSWVVGPSGQGYFHNCGVSLLKFDTSALAGKTIRSALLELTPCTLASGYLGVTNNPSTGQLDPATAAQYLVRGLSGGWNPATVTFRSLPQVHTAPSWLFPAPTTAAKQQLDVTAIVRNWVAGSWANNGLAIEQSPIQDYRSFSYAGRTWDNQNQTTDYCSIERNLGGGNGVPTLIVTY